MCIGICNSIERLSPPLCAVVPRCRTPRPLVVIGVSFVGRPPFVGNHGLKSALYIGCFFLVHPAIMFAHSQNLRNSFLCVVCRRPTPYPRSYTVSPFLRPSSILDSCVFMESYSYINALCTVHNLPKAGSLYNHRRLAPTLFFLFFFRISISPPSVTSIPATYILYISKLLRP